MTGLGKRPATEMLPLLARLLAHCTPPPEMVIVVPPETGPLNNWKVFPIARAGPKLFTLTVPVPELARVPVTIASPLEGEEELLTETDTFPAMLTLLLTERVLLPNARVPAAFTVTVPAITPLPPRLPPVTVMALVPLVPLISNMPALTVVAPV